MSARGNETAFKVLIVGGGTGGIAVAARLARALPEGSVALFEPSETHYYQPLFTLVGGGAAKLADTRRPTAALIPEGVRWIKQRVEAIDPASNTVETSEGIYRYDYLVMSPGIHVDWAAIPGLLEGLGRNGVCSNYSERYVETTWKAIRRFRGGTAIFTFPSTPIKCGGAPQKIMYLAEDYFRQNGMRQDSRIVFASAGQKLFAVKKYADSLERIVRERGIETLFDHDLVEVDADRQVATFRKTPSGERVETPFDLLHVTPPMRAPDFVRNGPLASMAGWIDVDKATLQHVRFPNVFALGDASSLPTSKTGAGIRKQAPVLVDNLRAAMAGRPLTARYDGYTSCPLVTGYGKLILAEFDYEGTPRETFPFDQSKERHSMYILKKHVLPKLYWHGMMRGRA
jgi:sulfide:quinone oxidoreductase